MNRTTLRLALLTFCAAASLVILQNAFDKSDHKKAEHAVRSYAVGGRVLGPYLEARSPGGQWTTEITHACRGVVRTTYAGPTARYEFDYDLVGHAIHPGNELGKEALQRFVQPAVSDGGVPPR